MNLINLTKKLYNLTGKLNLYICKEKKPDLIRLKKELIEINKIILNIEATIEALI